jgi:hypothetical protein
VNVLGYICSAWSIKTDWDWPKNGMIPISFFPFFTSRIFNLTLCALVLSRVSIAEKDRQRGFRLFSVVLQVY